MVGWANVFRVEPFPDLSINACKIWSRSDGRVEKNGGTDIQAHTHKGTPQFYIVDSR